MNDVTRAFQRNGGFTASGWMHPATVTLGSLGAIALLATLSYRYLELPGIRWGKRLTLPATEST